MSKKSAGGLRRWLLWAVFGTLMLVFAIQLYFFSMVCWYARFNPSMTSMMSMQLDALREQNPKAALAVVLSERGRAAGAINTLVFADGQIRGDNTDGAGLVNDILRNAGVAIAGKRVLMLGAGGASQGCILPLLGQEPASLVIANRTRANADKLVERFRGAGAVSACEFGAIDQAYDIVINGTSASLADDLPPVPAKAFSTETLALDMMYGNKPSRFMAFAAEHGATVRDGLGMLVEQAAEAFLVWRGVRPETAEILNRIRRSL